MSMESFFGSRGGQAASGAAMGSMFGPVGAVAGGLAGGLGLFGGGVNESKLKRRATKQGYAYAEQAVSYLGAGREQAESIYQSKLSTARSRFAASGGVMDSSNSAWMSMQGELLREKNEALATLSAEEKEFRGSESYDWFKQDYKMMTEATKVNKDANGRVMGLHETGRTGERMFTEDQFKKVRQVDWGGGIGDNAYNEYVSRFAPTLAEWEKGRFGSDEDRAAMSKSIDAKIGAANEWLDRKIKIRDARKSAENKFYGGLN